MENLNFDRKTATLDLAARFTYPSPFAKIARAETFDEAVALFGAAMEAEGISGKAGYLDLRDALRAALRQAASVQRARRAEEVRIRDAVRDGASEGGRAGIYEDRMNDRRIITGLIAARRAGKRWAAEQRSKEIETSVADAV